MQWSKTELISLAKAEIYWDQDINLYNYIFFFIEEELPVFINWISASNVDLKLCIIELIHTKGWQFIFYTGVEFSEGENFGVEFLGVEFSRVEFS